MKIAVVVAQKAYTLKTVLSIIVILNACVTEKNRRKWKERNNYDENKMKLLGSIF